MANTAVDNMNRLCYRAQCYETTKSVANVCQLEEHEYSTSFQSRLGKLPWIKPYTDEWLNDLRKKGIKKLAIICPSFYVDCLETLEEINLQAKEQWLASGGDTFTMIPCLNNTDEAAETIQAIIESSHAENTETTQ